MPREQATSNEAAGTDRDRHALNFAFSELGLCWHWDEETYRSLQPAGCERDKVRAFLQARHRHLLTVYDVDFLADAVVQTKARYYAGELAGAHTQSS